jgi:hypothetical protein
MSEKRSFTHEFRGASRCYSRPEALAAALAHAKAAGELSIPFRLEHIHYRAFRDGGNVVKAHCEAYRVTLLDGPTDEGHEGP